MNCINVYKNISISCEDGEWGDADLDYYKIVIEDIVKEYEKIGFNPDRYTSVLVVHSPYDYPMCCNLEDIRCIYITTKDNYWCQFAYQFAHEYCHHLIDGPLDGEKASSFWFEESLCELSSVYYMRRIVNLWRDGTIPTLSSYSELMFDYCEKLMSDIPECNSISLWIAENIEKLAANEYHRDMYKIIAKALYPVFEEYPNLWRLLPFLKRVPQDEYVNFEHWITCVVATRIPYELYECFTFLRGKIIIK